ncbi:MAG: hypothetical protein RLZZ536_1949 [Planctomycetota bacterium]
MRKPRSHSGNQQSASCRGQISGWKARSTFIRVHSWFKITPAFPFASSRLRVNSTGHKPRSRSGNQQAAGCRGQISGWKARATFNRKRRSGTLMSIFLTRRREGKRRLLRWAGRRARARARLIFVSIRGSKHPPAKFLPGRSRAGKPELPAFVVHSWFIRQAVESHPSSPH